jgi:hypothetical protein
MTDTTLVLACVALVVAVAAAVRSTWSPCGLSMLSTITPIGERAKGHRYAGTVAWFVLGATVGGLLFGTLAAGLAAVVGAAHLSDSVRLGVALAAVVVAVVSDRGLAGVRVPVHMRQVNERWLDAYRPWAYGAGFGVQIGCGLATYITTAAVYLTVVLAALTGDPLAAVAVGAVFGVARGMAVTLTARINSPSVLLAFHQRFEALRPWADRAVAGTCLVVAGVLGVALGPGAVVVVGGVLLVAVGVRLAGGGRRRPTARPDPGARQSLSAEPWTTAAAGVSSPSRVDAPSLLSASVAAAAPASVPPSSAGGTGSGRVSRQRR